MFDNEGVTGAILPVSPELVSIRESVMVADISTAA
jgi:hypothetical protein